MMPSVAPWECEGVGEMTQVRNPLVDLVVVIGAVWSDRNRSLGGMRRMMMMMITQCRTMLPSPRRWREA